jgi:hypothetical protein
VDTSEKSGCVDILKQDNHARHDKSDDLELFNSSVRWWCLVLSEAPNIICHYLPVRTFQQEKCLVLTLISVG